jgi:PAS domain S-box-containing protein
LSGQAIAAAGDAVVTVDTGGTITSWNAAAERLLGHRQSEAVGETLALIIPPEHRPRHVAAFHAAMDSGKFANGGRPARVDAMTASDGTRPFVFSLGLLTSTDGDAVGAVAILRPTVDPIPFV